MSRTIETPRRAVEVSRPDKVLFPDAGLTKADLAEYYAQVADVMLAHLAGRPLTLRRFPDGIDGKGWFQKRVPDHFPDWVDRVDVPLREGGTKTELLCRDAATLVLLADQAAIELHPWLSRRDELERPDRLVVDLDPSGTDFEVVRHGARALGEALSDQGLVPHYQTTGSRGLHVVAPIERRHGFDRVRAFATELTEALAADEPDRFTTAHRKAKRGDRVFLDVARNGYGQTSVAPYSVRARPGAPVATPLDPEEVRRGGFEADTWTLGRIGRRLAQKEDPWAAIDEAAAPLPG